MNNWNDSNRTVQRKGWKTEKNNQKTSIPKFGPSKYEYEYEYEYEHITEEEFDEMKERENTDAYYHDTYEYER